MPSPQLLLLLLLVDAQHAPSVLDVKAGKAAIAGIPPDMSPSNHVDPPQIEPSAPSTHNSSTIDGNSAYAGSAPVLTMFIHQSSQQCAELPVAGQVNDTRVFTQHLKGMVVGVIHTLDVRVGHHNVPAMKYLLSAFQFGTLCMI